MYHEFEHLKICTCPT